jgi:hypothetical protein
MSIDLEAQIARDEENYRMRDALRDDPFESEFASVAERAAEIEIDEAGDGQFLFVIEDGKKVTLDTLFERGTPVLYEFSLGSKSVKGSGTMGLIPFYDPEMLLLVPARAGKVTVEPTYDGNGILKHVTVRAQVKPLTVFDAKSSTARDALGM